MKLTYRFLNHKEETEIRLVNPNVPGKATSIFIHDENEFINVCGKYNGKMNIYAGINERKCNGTKSEDVITVNAIVIDIDSLHPRGVPANHIEMLDSLRTAEAIYERLYKSGKRPMMAMSGNGWQLWMKVFIPINDGNRRSIEATIKYVHQQIIKDFKSDKSSVDNIGDLARVIKVIGTQALKEKEEDDRLFRTSRWVKKNWQIRTSKWSRKLIKMAESGLITNNYGDGTISDIEVETVPEDILKRYAKLFDQKMKDIFKGDWGKYHYQSRSEAEFALICLMARNGIPRKHVWDLMNQSHVGKWQEKSDLYKKRTILKAYGFMEVAPNGFEKRK